MSVVYWDWYWKLYRLFFNKAWCKAWANDFRKWGNPACYEELIAIMSRPNKVLTFTPREQRRVRAYLSC